MQLQLLKTIGIAALAATIFVTTSCNKKNDDATPTGTIYLHMHSNVDSSEVESSEEWYADATGRHISLSTAQFYIADVTLKNANGTTYTISKYVLKTIDSEEYLVGTAPVGTYTGVSMTIGVKGTDNTAAASGTAATNPLADENMWFSDHANGHIFLKIEGRADTTAAQNGTGSVPFAYYVGGSANLKTIDLPARTGSFTTYILTAGNAQFVHLVADYGKLLSVLDFKTQDSTNSFSQNPVIATTIANNMGNFIRYEE